MKWFMGEFFLIMMDFELCVVFFFCFVLYLIILLIKKGNRLFMILGGIGVGFLVFFIGVLLIFIVVGVIIVFCFL